MSQSATDPLAFAVPTALPPEVDFLGGRLTSDGGLPWLAEADAELGLCQALAAVIPDWRKRRGRHDLVTLVTQRVYQIACGYEDQNDATTLRADPLLKLVCGRLPATDPDLASQPTLSRLENASSARTCYRLAVALGQIYLRERERAGVPRHIILDLAGTDDPAHGQQEGVAYHGYYRQYMYHPLLIFDGATDHLITAILRPGTVQVSHRAVAIVKRIVAALRARWPDVTIEIRADCGFAGPALYDYCEAEGIDFTLGLATNPRLAKLAGSLQAEAEQQFTTTGHKARVLGETTYQASTWPAPRRVVVKAERLSAGLNTRYVVTMRPEPPDQIYDGFSVQRGESENWIKGLKRDCCADRLSCHRFWANQFRLLLHAAAYWLLDTLRRWLVAAQVARMELAALRLRLLKIGGWVRQQRDRVRLRLAPSHPNEAWWRTLAAARHGPS